MAFLRKFIAVIGRGPTALATAGVVGASVSAPHVVDSVGPGCLGNMNGVGDAWISGSRWTKIAQVKKSGDLAPEWAELGGIKEADIGKKQKAFPCYSFLTTYGGAISNELEEKVEESSNLANTVVERKCSDRLWKAVEEAVKKGWDKFKKEIEKLNGTQKANVEIKEDEIRKVIEKLKQADSSRKEGTLWKLMTEIRSMSQTFWSKEIDKESKKTVYAWWQENVFGEKGDYGMKLEHWPDWFEYGAKKIIDLDKKFSTTKDKLKQGLSNTPTFCAST